MPPANVADKVKDILVDEYQIDGEKIKPEATFVDDLGLDSLDVVELVMSLEEWFNIEIPDEDAEKLKTVGEAVAYLEGLDK